MLLVTDIFPALRHFLSLPGAHFRLFTTLILFGVIAGLDPAIQGNKRKSLRPWILGSPLRYAQG